MEGWLGGGRGEERKNIAVDRTDCIHFPQAILPTVNSHLDMLYNGFLFLCVKRKRKEKERPILNLVQRCLSSISQPQSSHLLSVRFFSLLSILFRKTMVSSPRFVHSLTEGRLTHRGHLTTADLLPWPCQTRRERRGRCTDKRERALQVWQDRGGERLEHFSEQGQTRVSQH